LADFGQRHQQQLQRALLAHGITSIHQHVCPGVAVAAPVGALAVAHTAVAVRQPAGMIRVLQMK
jgi:hypothetical protein